MLSTCRALSPLGQTVRQHVDRTAHLTPKTIRGLGQVLGLLPPGLRAQVAQAAINMRADGDRAMAIAELVPGLADLSQARRDALFDAAIHLPDDMNKARAIAALAAELDQLAPQERHAVIHAVDHLLEGPLQVEAICGLCRAVEALDEPQLDQFTEEVLDVGGPARGQAIGALGTALARLAEARRNEVFNAVMQLDDAGKCRAIRGLGADLASLAPAQVQTLVAQAVNLPPMPDKAFAMAGLAAAAAHLDADRRRLLIDAALALPQDARGGEAMGSLGGGHCLHRPGPESPRDCRAGARMAAPHAAPARRAQHCRRGHGGRPAEVAGHRRARPGCACPARAIDAAQRRQRHSRWLPMQFIAARWQGAMPLPTVASMR